MLIEGPPRQVLKEATATSFPLTNNIRVAGTSQRKTYTVLIPEPCFPGHRSPASLLSRPSESRLPAPLLPASQGSISIHKASGAAFPIWGPKITLHRNWVFLTFSLHSVLEWGGKGGEALNNSLSWGTLGFPRLLRIVIVQPLLFWPDSPQKTWTGRKG